MPASTSRLALPYPLAADSADVPRDVKALADRVEALSAWIRNQDLQSQSVGESNLTTALQARAVPQAVSALPGSPNEGDRVLYANAAMQAAGVYWALRYVLVQVTYRWVFVGGGVYHSGNSGNATNIPTVYTADPTVQIPLPLNGVYRVEYGATGLSVGAGQSVNIAPSAGGGAPAAPADLTNDRIGVAAASTITVDSVAGVVQPVTYTGPGNPVRLYEKASATGATPAIGQRWLSLIPIAVG